MNTEMIELSTVEGEVKADETFQLLDLAIDDLDLVGGGHMVGALS